MENNESQKEVKKEVLSMSEEIKLFWESLTENEKNELIEFEKICEKYTNYGEYEK